MDDMRVVNNTMVTLVSRQAKKDFIERLAIGGLTVLPEFQLKWWKYAE